ncbi:unnamed protein product [Adineta ricciae]|uniref:Uncharacterized protein n=1 Tax=Adineta ricciae TaxID=249248 RepID=A0A816E3W6_ADIRI|nr:unnamed protein product [Adineta ricciae]
MRNCRGYKPCSGGVFDAGATSQVIMARSVPAGSSHFPTVSCKLRAGNGQELIGYFLCNSGRNFLESAKTVPESRRAVPEPTQVLTDPVAGMIDLGSNGDCIFVTVSPGGVELPVAFFNSALMLCNSWLTFWNCCKAYKENISKLINERNMIKISFSS